MLRQYWLTVTSGPLRRPPAREDLGEVAATVLVTVRCTVGAGGVDAPVLLVFAAAVDPQPARSPAVHSAPNPQHRLEANNPFVALTGHPLLCRSPVDASLTHAKRRTQDGPVIPRPGTCSSLSQPPSAVTLRKRSRGRADAYF
jgi:hypothetical protein